MRQRIRWAKGHLQAFVETGWPLLKHVFVTGGAANRDDPEAPKWRKLIRNIRLRFMSFDMLTVVYPRSIITLARRLIVFALQAVLIFGAGLTVTANYGPTVLSYPVLKLLGINASVTAGQALIFLSVAFISWTLYTYVKGMILAAYIFIAEYKRIMPIKWYKKLWYCLTFPIFDLIGKLSLIIALFTKVEWKPIPHHASVKISQIEKNLRS